MLLLSTGNEAEPPGSIALPHRELPIKWKALNGIADEPKASLHTEAWTFILPPVPTHMGSVQLLTLKAYLFFSHLTHRLDPYAVMAIFASFWVLLPSIIKGLETPASSCILLASEPSSFLLVVLAHCQVESQAWKGWLG